MFPNSAVTIVIKPVSGWQDAYFLSTLIEYLAWFSIVSSPAYKDIWTVKGVFSYNLMKSGSTSFPSNGTTIWSSDNSK